MSELPDLSELDGLLLHFGGGSEKSDSGYVFDAPTGLPMSDSSHTLFIDPEDENRPLASFVDSFLMSDVSHASMPSNSYASLDLALALGPHGPEGILDIDTTSAHEAHNHHHRAAIAAAAAAKQLAQGRLAGSKAGAAVALPPRPAVAAPSHPTPSVEDLDLGSFSPELRAAIAELHATPLTALRHRFQSVFKKPTSSNNRRWLLKRLTDYLVDAHSGQQAAAPLPAAPLSPHTSKPQGPASPISNVTHIVGLKRVSSVNGPEEGQGQGPAKLPRLDVSLPTLALLALPSPADGPIHAAAEPSALSEDSMAEGCGSKAHSYGLEDDTGTHRNAAPAPVAPVSLPAPTWSRSELQALVAALELCGVPKDSAPAKWPLIAALGIAALVGRTPADLGDMWGALSRAAGPCPPCSGAAAAMPIDLVARVRALL